MNMRVKRSVDCGNSPKNKTAEDVVVAYLSTDHDKLDDLLASDCRPDVLGIDTKTKLSEDRREFKSKAESLAVHSVATHGRAGAVEGVLGFKGGIEKPFCVMLRFATAAAAKVSEFRLYLP